MAAPETGRGRRRWRAGFRWLRRLVLLFVLLLLGTLIYLNQVGLPDFVKNPLLENLRARGIELQFNRLRLRLGRGLVAEKVRVGRADETSSPQLEVRQLQLRLDLKGLLKGQVRVDALVLRHGKFSWPVL